MKDLLKIGYVPDNIFDYTEGETMRGNIELRAIHPKIANHFSKNGINQTRDYE